MELGIDEASHNFKITQIIEKTYGMLDTTEFGGRKSDRSLHR